MPIPGEASRSGLARLVVVSLFALLGARYTNRAAGWEKGHVEGTVGWAKRQILTDLEVRDWEELWRVLKEGCDQDARERRHVESGKLVAELFEEESSLPLAEAELEPQGVSLRLSSIQAAGTSGGGTKHW